MLATLSPEAQLFLLTARSSSNDEDLRRLVHAPLDWPRFMVLVDRESAASVVWNRLEPLRDAGIPDLVAAHLHKLAMIAEFRMANLEQRLVEGIGLLGRWGISVVLLKGAALAKTAYPSFVMRPMSDLDLLVEEARAEEARALLLAHGWKPSFDSELEERYKNHHHLAPLDDARGTGVGLDVHTSLFFPGHPFSFSADMVRAKAEDILLGSYRAFVPRSSHQLLHTCLHFAWSNLMQTSAWRSFRDVDALERSGRIDWSEIVRVATESRGATCCYWTLHLARRLTGAAIPAEVIDALRPPHSEFILQGLERHIVHQLFPSESTCPSVSLGNKMWEYAIMPNWSGHGGVRPWSHDFLPSSAPATAPSATRKYADHLRRIGDWHKYLRAMLGRSTARADHVGGGPMMAL